LGDVHQQDDAGQGGESHDDPVSPGRSGRVRIAITPFVEPGANLSSRKVVRKPVCPGFRAFFTQSLRQFPYLHRVDIGASVDLLHEDVQFSGERVMIGQDGHALCSRNVLALVKLNPVYACAPTY
jgi:hypothetical protein